MGKRLVALAAMIGLGLALPVGAAQAAGKAATKAGASTMPGPRTCFWYRGPHNKDPYINVAYPDAGAFYWSAVASIPKGATLRLKGQYPHARYMSFVSYRATGQAVESLPDYQIAPDPGSSNPFMPGADRSAAKRSYTVTVALRADSKEAGEGKLVAGDGSNTLRAPLVDNGNSAVSILYRIYANDKAHPVTGGMPLPEAELTLTDGQVLRGEAACQAMNTRQTWTSDVTALGVPVTQYLALRSQPGKPATWPAQPQMDWHVQHPRAAVASIFTGGHEKDTARGGGEFYPNPDNRYARAMISTKFGPVVVLRGKMPLTPTTQNGDKVMGQGQLRYWSLCSNTSMVDGRVVDCLYDEQIPLDANRNYVIVLSKPKDRPRNARPECGLAWLPLPEDGDKVGDPDFSLLVIRNMLADPAFAQSLQAALDDKDLPKMGEYLPKGQHLFPNTVESLFPCPL